MIGLDLRNRARALIPYLSDPVNVLNYSTVRCMRFENLEVAVVLNQLDQHNP